MTYALLAKMKANSGDDALAVLLYAFTIFLGAFLLFQVQPIIGKMILPWFGGSAAVWSACLLFFQVLLLLGYLYAHWIVRRLAPRTQALLHIALLAISMATLPIVPNATWKPNGGGDPTLLIVGLMTATIGLPYFLLSTTGPLVQAWFAREKPGAVPYRLFALSNFGSLLGLLSYPVLFEPWLALPQLSVGWSAAYAGFAVICALLAWRARRTGHTLPAQGETAATAAPAAGETSLWILLAACPTILLMSVTAHVTRDIAPVPFLWVLPLALYLSSFILCFEGRAWYRRPWYLPVFLVWLAVVNVDLIVPITGGGLWKPIALYCGGLFVACMVCHGELARLKPHPQHLTSFYLMIATGGALGGSFVALIAPRVFNADYELPITVVVAAIAVFVVLRREPDDTVQRVRSKDAWQKAIVFVVTLVSILAVWGTLAKNSVQKIMARNFYGTLKISDVGEGEDAQRRLAHGVILHGSQFRYPARRRWPTTYYSENSGAGIAILATRNDRAQRVGVVGLGAGTLATYGRHGDRYRFYEINPLVISLAASEFSFMSDSRATVEVAPGDARLALEKESAQGFDVLVIDAFSGDSIPVHLLTREVFQVYFRHLNPDGILAVHISNKNLDLAPVVKLAADHYGKTARRVDSAGNANRGTYDARWILVSDRAAVFDAPRLKNATGEIAQEAPLRPWTDDYSSIFSILN